MIDARLVARLRGAPISVLFSLMAYGSQCVDELVISTDIGRVTVMKGTAVLSALGYIEREHYRAKWQLSTSFTQMPLIGLSEAESLKNELSANGESSINGLSRAESSKIQLSAPLVDSSSTTTREGDVKGLLILHGVRNPALQRLCNLPHVTTELIEGHFVTSESTGQAIYRIRNNWAVPVTESAECDAVPEEYRGLVKR